MKVCIDIQSVIKNPTGIGRYTEQLVRAMSKLTLPEDFQCTLSYFNCLGKYKGLPIENSQFQNRGIKCLPGRIYAQLWKKLYFPPYNMLSGTHDVYHFPNFNMPPMSKGKSIVTIHDLAFMRYPQYIEPKNLIFLQNQIPKTIKRAHKIIVVSEFTKKELIKMFDVDEEKVVVVHEGIGEQFRTIDNLEVRCRYNLPSSYLFTTSTIEPRKNIEGLVKAFGMGRFKGYKLAIAGIQGWLYDDLYNLIKKMNLKDDIIFLGYVPDSDLPALYSMAEAFVFPSFYEGFGLPPLEAMACGVPVVSAKVSSLSEVLGDGARFIDPKNPEDIAEGIRDVLDKKEEYVKKGLEWSKKYTWEKAAKETLGVYENSN